jgi:hypothetical protein
MLIGKFYSQEQSSSCRISAMNKRVRKIFLKQSDGKMHQGKATGKSEVLMKPILRDNSISDRQIGPPVFVVQVSKADLRRSLDSCTS